MMWAMLGLFGGVIAILFGLAPLGIAGIAVGVICQVAERKDEEVWEQVQDTAFGNIYPILSIVAALVIAAFCFVLLGVGLGASM